MSGKALMFESFGQYPQKGLGAKIALFYHRGSKMKVIKVAVGVLRNKSGQLLFAKRQVHQFMAGFWELPGGKIEANETNEAAVSRELTEELGVQVTKLSLHQTLSHQYPDRKVMLNIYNIDAYTGVPYGKEGQQTTWMNVEDLRNYQLLPNMQAFINSITLPNKYWITPALNHQSSAWTRQFEQKLTIGIKLIQLRSKTKLDNRFIEEINNKCQQNNVKLLLNIPNKTFNTAFNKICCSGWHLSTNEMLLLKARPCADDKLLGVSTHNLDEALRAQAIDADFVVISPVQATQTHPDATPLGWNAAKEVVDALNIPVYFLGGMTLKNLGQALKSGAQGIAGVSAF